MPKNLKSATIASGNRMARITGEGCLKICSRKNTPPGGFSSLVWDGMAAQQLGPRQGSGVIADFTRECLALIADTPPQACVSSRIWTTASGSTASMTQSN